MQANFVIEEMELDACFKVNVPKGVVITSHTDLTGRDNANQHPVEAITGLSDELTDLNDRLTTLEGNDHDLGEQVQTIQADVNALKVVKPLDLNKTETQSLSGALDVTGQLDIVGSNNGYAMQFGFQDDHSYINSNLPLNIHPESHFQKSPTVSDITSYKDAPSQSLVRKQQVEQAIADISTGGSIDLTDYAKKSDIVAHNLNDQAHNDIRNQVASFQAELNDAIGDIAALQADTESLRKLISSLQDRIAVLEAKKTVVSDDISSIASMSKADYDALPTKDATTLYLTSE